MKVIALPLAFFGTGVAAFFGGLHKQEPLFADRAQCEATHKDLLAEHATVMRKYEELKIEHETMRKQFQEFKDAHFHVVNNCKADPKTAGRILQKPEPEGPQPVELPPTPKPETLTKEEKKALHEDILNGTDLSPWGEHRHIVTTTTTTTTTLPPYRPPEGETGFMSETDGYDYRQAGEDWKTHFAQCGGAMQSPVDIDTYVPMAQHTMTMLWFDYSRPGATQVRNAGHGLYADTSGMGSLKWGADTFKLAEMTVHTPAEHRLDGVEFPLEVQLLHRTADGKTLVVAVLFKEGKSSKFLQDLEAAVPTLPVWKLKGGAEHYEANLDPLESLLRFHEIYPGGDLSFYNYDGSLTQPPCTEGVEWWVGKEALTATPEEIARLLRSYKASGDPMPYGNSRALQALNGRQIQVAHANLKHSTTAAMHKDLPPAGHSTGDHPWDGGKHWDNAVDEDGQVWRQGLLQKKNGQKIKKTKVPKK